MTDLLQNLPVLPLRNSVVFPHVLMPLSVGRQISIAAVEAALATEEKEIVLVAQKNMSAELRTQDDLYTVGTKGIIKKLQRAEKRVVQLIVQGIDRVVLVKLERTQPYPLGRVRQFPTVEQSGPEVEALHRALLDLLGRAMAAAQPEGGGLDVSQLLGEAEDPWRLVYHLGSMLTLDIKREQALLEAPGLTDALRLMYDYLSYEVQVLELRKGITSKAQTEMNKQQREYYLRQQLKAIQQELGEQDPEQAETALLRERFSKADLPETAKKEIERELSRLERLPAMSPEHSMLRSYVELVLELPWHKASEDRIDIPFARQVLNEDHYDLEEIKERILEHLGVLKLNPEAKAPILCFVGPPGVGKTSLGQSIARALGRTFERMSLGGMHDEAELRGHRRTYIGAMPGRIIQAIRRAGVNNPVLMLDEVDKLGRDFRGDPAAALLEILDPAQNKEFRDNYLEIPFDLSRVFFITTANTLENTPAPLLDRMEILHLSGYSQEEKSEIARRYLIPRQVREAGLDDEKITITDEALQRVISSYTREAGVRQLERAIGRLTRKVALQFAEGKTELVTVSAESLIDLLGPERIQAQDTRENLPAGVAIGLAWTETGGDVLFIEATLLPDGKGLTLTGQLGEVMRESAQAAQSYIWSHADAWNIEADIFRNSGVHIHVPAGAIPKDGPSAGVTIACALVSMYTSSPVRPDTAMTGEISLRGRVLPVGGIKEKVLAARRAGCNRVILPKRNEQDLRDLPENIRQNMEFVLVERVEEALENALPHVSEELRAKIG